MASPRGDQRNAAMGPASGPPSAGVASGRGAPPSTGTAMSLQCPRPIAATAAIAAQSLDDSATDKVCSVDENRTARAATAAAIRSVGGS